ncbi:hypothetical protein I6L81_00005 [Providencia rettgeri]|uniref:tail fiber/spike domain-containing protein n=1 Tax=Providencia rettgeri TaxID=587 RepID=UPI001C235F9C|nr:hypothetical protein [Providencia rettgeri]QXB91413.1 hypothetical protein I6L81_00005 [Providencia rettgeri]
MRQNVKPTQEPVPSSDIKDLFFNSGLLDIWATSLEPKYIDRFGNCHLTAAGMEWLFKELVESFKVDMNTAIIAAGYITIDSFQQGADLPNNELTQRNHILRDETTGEYYRWDGDLPKQVPAGSTPQSTGGIGKGAWVSVGDASVRSELKKFGRITKTYNTFADMSSDASVAVGDVVKTLGYYDIDDGGDAEYVITAGVEECVGICPRLPNGNIAVLKNEFSVKALSCGVRFNGVASEDNTTKYENAANYCATKQLLLTYPKGKFVASRDITVTGAVQDMGVQGFSRDQIHSWIHMNGFTLNRIGANTRTEGVVFTSNGRNNTPRDKPTIKHIHNAPLSHADVDAYYYNCNILESFNLVHITGRGITFTNCNLSVFTYAVSLHWQEGHDPSATDPERTNEQGMRVYVFNGCRFHGAINGYIIENRGFNKLNTRGLALNDCYIDTGCGYIIGSMHDFNISVTHLHANRKLFELADGDELVNGVLSGVIKGRVNAAAENGGALERVIEQRGDTSRIDGVTISANIERISQAAYSLSGIVGELTITGHHRDIGRDNGINGAQNMFIDATRVKEYTGSVVLTGGSAMFSDPSKTYEYATNGVPDGVLMVNSFKTNVRDLTSHSIRGRNGDISRHTFTGDGTGTRQIQLPANAMYCLIYVIDGNNGGRSLIAIDTRFGGVGDAVIRNDNILEVKGIFNTSSIKYMYVVNY